MPEGHILHRLARDQHAFVGRTLAVSSPQGRFAAGATELDAHVLDAVEAYGKHLFHRFSDAPGLHTHLGLRGTWLRHAAPIAAPRSQVRVRLATETLAWDLIAPAACELLTVAAERALLDRLGPDPLRPDTTADAGRAALTKSSAPIGVALLDQSVVAGVGNVVRAEALFACGIHPARPADSLRRDEAACLWDALVAILRTGVEEGRLITVSPPSGVERRDLSEAEGRMVYKQTRCRSCGTPVVSWTLQGRTAYACPRHQPDPR